MSTKRFKALKTLSTDELNTKTRELESNLFQARMKAVTGQLENTSSLWLMRKDLTMIKTIQTQQKSAQTGSAPKAGKR